MGFMVNLASNIGVKQTNSSGTIALPTGWSPGDIGLIFLVSGGNPTVAFGGGSGWTLQGAQKDGGSSVGFRIALFRRTMVAGDTAPTFTHTGGFYAGICVIIKSDVDGGSANQKIGNAPSQGYSATYSRERTINGTTLDFAAFSEDGAVDYKIGFGVASFLNTVTVTPFTGFQELIAWNYPGGTTGGIGAWFSQVDDVATTATGWTTTAATGKCYTFSILLTDGSGAVGLQTADISPDDIAGGTATGGPAVATAIGQALEDVGGVSQGQDAAGSASLY